MRFRADAYLNLGKHAEAIADFERALALKADDESLLNNLLIRFSDLYHRPYLQRLAGLCGNQFIQSLRTCRHQFARLGRPWEVLHDVQQCDITVMLGRRRNRVVQSSFGILGKICTVKNPA